MYSTVPITKYRIDLWCQNSNSKSENQKYGTRFIFHFIRSVIDPFQNETSIISISDSPLLPPLLALLWDCFMDEIEIELQIDQFFWQKGVLYCALQSLGCGHKAHL